MAKRIKYPKENYKDYDVSSCDMESDVLVYHSQIVRTRKNHVCCYCGSVINKDDDALNFHAITESGFCSGHYCLDCIEDYMDNSNEIIDSDEVVRRYSERLKN